MTIETTKLAQLRARWDAGDAVGVLRIAARFGRLGDDAETITRGWAAVQHASFYVQTGADPLELIEAALAAVQSRYNLPDLAQRTADDTGALVSGRLDTN